MKPPNFLIAVIFFAILLLAGCSKINENDFTISGSIESYSYVPNRELRFCSLPTKISDLRNSTVFGTAGISSSGAFTIEDLVSPNIILLVPLDSIFGKGIVKSDGSARGCRASLYVFTNEFSTYIGAFAKGNTEINVAPGSVKVKYIYVNKDVNISGTGVHKYSSSFYNLKDTINCNLAFKAGWNKFIGEITALNGYSITSNAYNNEPDGLKWYYFSFK